MAVDSLSHLCSADCLRFYKALPLLLPSEETSKIAQQSRKTHDHPSAVKFQEDPVVARSLASLFASGIEYDMMGSDDEDDSGDTTVASMREAVEILASARSIVAQLFCWAEKGARSAKDAGKEVQIDDFSVAAAALSSLRLFGSDFPSDSAVLRAMSLKERES